MHCSSMSRQHLATTSLRCPGLVSMRELGFLDWRACWRRVQSFAVGGRQQRSEFSGGLCARFLLSAEIPGKAGTHGPLQ